MQTGKVIIAGAGPGDPELITLKALRFLQQANVVLADRLVSEAILLQWANPKATLIHVGKENGNPCSFSQTDINALLVQHAQEGKLVLRLKGGDIAFFSNVLDELRVLKKHRISYEIIPGITAASGASAYTGIPLTARGFSGGVRMITVAHEEKIAESSWADWAQTEDTLVFYMSGKSLHKIALALWEHGISNDKKIAVIEQATTPAQRVFLYEVEALISGPEAHHFVSPTLLVIGKIATLYESFSWFYPANAGPASYFKALKAPLPVQESKCYY